MKHLILGTAGHIDHGKTSLVRALTGIDTDRLKEEKERGITIELGFAHMELPGDIRFGIVDVPGHERFVRTMVAGVGGMDMVMLVIAADEGVMPQTREHLEICQLLGVRKGLVALTKCDMVEKDWQDLVVEEVRDYLKGSFLDEAPILPVSARTGAGLDDLRSGLSTLAAEVEEKPCEGPFRLPVDRVFTVAGFGTVVKVKNLGSNAKLIFQLLGPHDADLTDDSISILSPVGEALVGLSVGDKVTVSVPRGELHLELLDIARSEFQ